MANFRIVDYFYFNSVHFSQLLSNQNHNIYEYVFRPCASDDVVLVLYAKLFKK